MKTKYFPPEFNKENFNCIYCNVYAKQFWSNTLYNKGGWLETKMRVSTCSHCQDNTYWYEGRMIVPDEAPIEPPHPDLPENCLPDYIEARSIYNRSPKASAAIMRLCLQKLMPHLGESGKNINDDIKSLVKKGLPILVQKALDYCRVIGNNAVHPGEIIINDTPEIALNLFQMINFIVEDRITKPREIENLYNTIPESSRTAIEERDKSV